MPHIKLIVTESKRITTMGKPARKAYLQAIRTRYKQNGKSSGYLERILRGLWLCSQVGYPLTEPQARRKIIFMQNHFHPRLKLKVADR